MIRRLFLFVFIGFISHSTYAQNKRVLDSLNIIYQNAKHDTTKILTLIEIAYEYQGTKPDTCILIAEKTLQMSEQMDFKRGIGAAWNGIGLGNMYKGDYQKAIKYTQKALNLLETIKENKGIARSLNTIGLAYFYQGNYPLALEYYQKCFKINEKAGDKRGCAFMLNNIGNIYKEQNNYLLALENLQKSLKISEEVNDKRAISYILNNIGNIYNKQGKWLQAIEYYERSLQLKKERKDRWAITYTLNGLAEVYQKQEDYDESIEYAQEGLKLAQDIKALAEIKMLSETLYQTYKLKGEYAQALTYFELAKQTNDSLFSIEKTKSIANLESRFLLERKEKELVLLAKDNELNKLEADKRERELQITKKQAEAERYEALARTEKDKRKQDSLYNLAQQAKLEAEKLKTQEERNQLAQEKKELEHQAEIGTQKQIRNAFLGISFVLIFIVSLVVVGLRQKQKANKVLQEKNIQIEHFNSSLKESLRIIDQQHHEIKKQNGELQQYNEELQQTQEEILVQRDMVLEKNEELEAYRQKISQSIESALLIQKAILPTQDKLRHLLKEYFILYRPKDVVSGDFYWANQIHEHKFLIVVDCTGHGVSGAFMTMIGSALLDRIICVLNIQEPHLILDKLHEEIQRVLQQNQTGNSDGMDISIVRWEEKNGQILLDFAAAKRPLYILTERIQKIEGSRKSVGGKSNNKIFEKTSLVLPSNSLVYMSTDGYADQNNAERNSFSAKGFANMLSIMAQIPIQEQKIILDKILNEHMVGTEQRDDILVVGFRL